MYVYLGDSVMSPAFGSLETKWAKAAYGIAIPNFLIAGSLYTHTASKLLFVRIFRHSHHLHSHTRLGWGVWAVLIVLTNGAAFVLAVGVPIFSYLIGIAASLFAAWYTYGIAGKLWLYKTARKNQAARTDLCRCFLQQQQSGCGMHTRPQHTHPKQQPTGSPGPLLCGGATARGGRLRGVLRP